MLSHILEPSPRGEIAISIAFLQSFTFLCILPFCISSLRLDGVDYESLSKEMTFSQNVSEQCISVEVYNDTTLELNESLTLSLSVSGVEDGVSISPQNVDVLVVNDDGKLLS